MALSAPQANTSPARTLSPPQVSPWPSWLLPAPSAPPCPFPWPARILGYSPSDNLAAWHPIQHGVSHLARHLPQLPFAWPFSPPVSPLSCHTTEKERGRLLVRMEEQAGWQCQFKYNVCGGPQSVTLLGLWRLVIALLIIGCMCIAAHCSASTYTPQSWGLGHSEC